MIIVTRFTASWCSPCKVLAPVFKGLEAEMTDIKFITVDVEEQPNVAALYQIRNVPTVIIEKDNVLIEKFVGIQPKQVYVATINGAMHNES
jgi:thioredoxin-like negative regulator of GroEL